MFFTWLFLHFLVKICMTNYTHAQLATFILIHVRKPGIHAKNCSQAAINTMSIRIIVETTYGRGGPTVATYIYR